jgi:membrane-associated phospholipid phosphatase
MPAFTKSRWFIVLLGCICAFICGLGFLVVTWLVRADLLRSFDFSLTVLIQDHVPQKFDEYLNWFGVIAKFQIIVPLLIVFLLVFRRWILALSSLALLFVAHLLEIVGKEILFQPPPPFMFYRHPTEYIFPDLHTFDHSSYPSGHTMRIIFAAVTMSMVIWQSRQIPAWVKVFSGVGVFGVAFLTMFSRVSLGEHWTSDVLGGLFLGLMIASVNVITGTLTRGRNVRLPREKQ